MWNALVGDPAVTPGRVRVLTKAFLSKGDMVAKRKAISQTLRFEVFKRDLFTCQYCGRKAPEVVLEIDHINPVSKGGTNAIENLISACKECNRGKGDKKLSDLTEAEKSRQQLEELQERKNMVDLICQWKEGFEDLNGYMVDKIEARFFELAEVENTSFSQRYRMKLSKAINDIGFEFVMEAGDLAVCQYVTPGMKSTLPNAIEKIIGIARNLKRYSINPIARNMDFTYHKARKKFSGYPQGEAYYKHGVFKYITLENYYLIVECLDDSDNWDGFIAGLDCMDNSFRRQEDGRRHAPRS